jgi:hypothetical protein
MHRRLLVMPLLGAALLLSTLGCSKKEVPSPVPGTGSYKLDGTAKTCQAKASISAGSIGSNTYDFLNLELSPTPETGNETLRLYLYKLPGAPSSTYLLNNLEIVVKGARNLYNFAPTSFTLTVTEAGGISGTFSAVVSASSSSVPGPYTTITEGSFTDVRP